MTKRVGLLGGTFDPPHIGHLVVADQVLNQLGLDEVRLVVANRPWQKVGAREISSAHRRLEMVVAAVEGCPGVGVSAVELEIGGPSYTAVTIETLEKAEPGVEWLVVVGADAAVGLNTWHRAEDLRASRRFVVVSRPGVKAEPPPGWDLIGVDIPALDVSSTDLRRLIGEGRSIRHLTPDAVVQRLADWGLYGRGS